MRNLLNLLKPRQRYEVDGMVSADGRWVRRHGAWWPTPFGGAVDMIQGNTAWHNDFLGPTGTNDTFFMGTRGGSAYVVVSGSTFAVQGVNGGVGRITLGGDGNDAVAVYGPLAYEPDEAARIWMQVRFQASVVATASIFIGFTDALTDSVIIENESGSLNTVATDAFGVLLEGPQDGTWNTIGVGNNVDDSLAASTAVIPDLGTSQYTTIHIEADSFGNAARTVVRYRVKVDGVTLITAATTTDGYTASVARSSIVYAPVISGDDRAVAYTMDVAEMAANGGIGASFD